MVDNTADRINFLVQRLHQKCKKSRLTTVGRALVFKNRADSSIRLCRFFIYGHLKSATHTQEAHRKSVTYHFFLPSDSLFDSCRPSVVSLFFPQPLILLSLLLQPLLLSALYFQPALLRRITGRRLAQGAEQASEKSPVALLLILHRRWLALCFHCRRIACVRGIGSGSLRSALVVVYRLLCGSLTLQTFRLRFWRSHTSNHLVIF